MVPPPTATAIIEQMVLCLLAADEGCFYLDSGGQGVWCREEVREQLEREGVQVVHSRRPWRIGGAKVLDDGAVVRSQPRRARRAPSVQAPRARATRQRGEARM
jgi:hypothetical protein